MTVFSKTISWWASMTLVEDKYLFFLQYVGMVVPVYCDQWVIIYESQTLEYKTFVSLQQYSEDINFERSSIEINILPVGFKKTTFQHDKVTLNQI